MMSTSSRAALQATMTLLLLLVMWTNRSFCGGICHAFSTTPLLASLSQHQRHQQQSTTAKTHARLSTNHYHSTISTTALSYSNDKQEEEPQQQKLMTSIVSPNLNAPKYLRWNTISHDDGSGSRKMELQTAVRTFVQRNQVEGKKEIAKVQVHAQLHVGDMEYFDYYNSDEFNNKHNQYAVLYELLVDDKFLELDDNGRQRRQLKTPIQASSNDHALAESYTPWVAQADRIQYHNNQATPWYHADYTRQEFLSRINDNNNDNNKKDETEKSPLWKLESSTPSSNRRPPPALATALLQGPPLLAQAAVADFGSYNKDTSAGGDGCAMPFRRQQSSPSPPPPKLQRMMFTNLFWPGDALATALRLLLWWTVPSPELSILLLDWSSIGLIFDHHDDYYVGVNDKDGWQRNNKKRRTRKSALSEIALPCVQALACGQWNVVRKLLFGQVAMLGHEAAMINNHEDNDDLLIAQRNDHALQVLEETLQQQQQEQGRAAGKDTISLLYGCNHCPDLTAKLLSKGFTISQTEWRTAWSVELPKSNNDDDAPSWNRNARYLSLGLIPAAYLWVGGMDWIATWQDIVAASSNDENVTGSVAVLALFYMLRHVLLYVGLSKVFLSWGEYNE